MKKQSKTTTVYRIDLEAGKYTTVSRAILMNPNLRDSSKTLIQLLLNNIEGWILRLGYYQKQLEWSNDKMAGAVANLIENGYLKKKQHPKGKDKGFYYTYVISEFGNLNPNKEQVSEEEILTNLETEETAEETAESKAEVQPVNADSIPKESNQQEPEQAEPVTMPVQPESNQEKLTAEISPEKTETFVLDVAFFNKVINLIGKTICSTTDTKYADIIFDHYEDQMNTGKLTAENFNEPQLIQLLRSKLIKKYQPVIEASLTRGTIAQKEIIRTKGMKYLTEAIEQGREISEYSLRNKMAGIRTSIIGANRVLDQRYQD